MAAWPTLVRCAGDNTREEPRPLQLLAPSRGGRGKRAYRRARSAADKLWFGWNWVSAFGCNAARKTHTHTSLALASRRPLGFSADGKPGSGDGDGDGAARPAESACGSGFYTQTHTRWLCDLDLTRRAMAARLAAVAAARPSIIGRLTFPATNGRSLVGGQASGKRRQQAATGANGSQREQAGCASSCSAASSGGGNGNRCRRRRTLKGRLLRALARFDQLPAPSREKSG